MRPDIFIRTKLRYEENASLYIIDVINSWAAWAGDDLISEADFLNVLENSITGSFVDKTTETVRNVTFR
jgi:hypothetical protein